MAKKKSYKDYTQEELNQMSYSEREKLQTIYTLKLTVKVILGIILAIFIICAIFSSFKSIPTGYVGVKTQFGKVQDTMLHEGMNMKIPFVEKIVLMDCRTQKVEYTMEASSKDLQVISDLKISINYNVNKGQANKLYREVGEYYVSTIIEPTIYDSVKNVVANYTAEQLITQRSEISAMCMDSLFAKLENSGITVTAFNILDLSFSEAFDQAVEAKQVTEQQAQKAQLELEKAKIENETKIENAKAEAEVMRQQNSQITPETLKLRELEIQEKFLEKWNGNLPSTMLSDNITGLFNIGD